MNNTTTTNTATAESIGSFFAEAVAFQANRTARLKALRAARMAVQTQNAGAVK